MLKRSVINRSIETAKEVFSRSGLRLPEFAFWTIDGVMYGVSGEVSSVCDDRNDNVFISGRSCRFPEIDEDEKAIHFLCQEYPNR